jgi:hypothetical protein
MIAFSTEASLSNILIARYCFLHIMPYFENLAKSPLQARHEESIRRNLHARFHIL